MAEKFTFETCKISIAVRFAIRFERQRCGKKIFPQDVKLFGVA